MQQDVNSVTNYVLNKGALEFKIPGNGWYNWKQINHIGFYFEFI